MKTQLYFPLLLLITLLLACLPQRPSPVEEPTATPESVSPKPVPTEAPTPPPPPTAVPLAHAIHHSSSSVTDQLQTIGNRLLLAAGRNPWKNRLPFSSVTCSSRWRRMKSSITTHHKDKTESLVECAFPTVDVSCSPLISCPRIYGRLIFPVKVRPCQEEG